MELFLPQLNADDVLRYAALRIGPDRVERVDAHTLRLRVGDVTYLPLPDFGPSPLAGLATLRLPMGVKYGQVFRVLFRQITPSRQVVGQFELRVRVEKANSIVDEDVNTLAVARHVAALRPLDNRWKPVLLRYADQLAERVRGLGVDPDLVRPSPLGADGSPGLSSGGQCRLLGWIVLVLAAVAAPLTGLLLGTSAAPLAWVVPLALPPVLYVWQRRCRPSLCKSLSVMGLGLFLGLALLVVLGGRAGTADQRFVLLATQLVLTVGIGLVGLARKCWGRES